MGRRAASSLRIRARARTDDGAAAVEFGLLLPLFVMLTLGTISAGFAFHAWLSVTHGAQESSRFAATLSIKASAPSDGGTLTTWLAEVSNRAVAASNLARSDGTFPPGSTVCVAVVSSANVPALSSHLTRHVDAAGVMSAGTPGGGPCPGLPTMSGDYVQTYVAQPVNFNYLLGSAQINVGSKSINRFEAVSLS